MGDRQAHAPLLFLTVLAVLALVLWWGAGEGQDEQASGARVGAQQAAQPAVLPDPPAAEALPLHGASGEVAELSGDAPGADATAAAALSAASDATGSLLVRVTWSSDGSPAAGIGLTAVQWERADPMRSAREGRSNENGEWLLERAPLGSVGVYTDRGFGGGTVVRARELATVTVGLPSGLTVRGHVVDGEHRPVAGADVWLGDSTRTFALAYEEPLTVPPFGSPPTQVRIVLP